MFRVGDVPLRTRRRFAVADAAEIVPKDVMSCGGQFAGERNMNPTGADVVLGGSGEQNDGRRGRFLALWRGQESEQPFVGAKADGPFGVSAPGRLILDVWRPC